MNTYKISLPESVDSVTVYTFADLHLGDAQSNVKEIKRQIKEVLEDQGCKLVILNGDLINNATRGSCSDPYSATMSPDEQIDKIVELFRPIKDYIVLITEGNHEERTYRQDGIHPLRRAAAELGVKNYTNESGVIFLTLGKNGHAHKQQYSIFVQHGRGGGRSAGAKLNAVVSMASVIDCDVYIHSHTHMPITSKQSFYRADSKNNKARLVEKLFVNTGAALDYGGYGETFGFTPASQSTPKIILSGKKRDMQAVL